VAAGIADRMQVYRRRRRRNHIVIDVPLVFDLVDLEEELVKQGLLKERRDNTAREIKHAARMMLGRVLNKESQPNKIRKLLALVIDEEKFT
jgi:hypothetical protein